MPPSINDGSASSNREGSLVIKAEECARIPCGAGLLEEWDCLVGCSGEIDQLRAGSHHPGDGCIQGIGHIYDQHAEPLDSHAICFQPEVLRILQTILILLSNDVYVCKTLSFRKLCPCYPLPIIAPNHTINFKIPTIGQSRIGG